MTELASRSWSPTVRDGSTDWGVHEYPDRFELVARSGSDEFVGRDVERLAVRRRWMFWFAVVVTRADGVKRYTGLGHRDAANLRTALRDFVVRVEVAGPLLEVVNWCRHVDEVVQSALDDGRWISEQSIVDLETLRPEVSAHAWAQLSTPTATSATLSSEEHDAVEFFGSPMRPWIDECNEQIVANELIEHRDFFDRIESSPLTEEQARAVICFDNRVNVVASAGSGKTSVMVARAAYAIYRGFVSPDRILLLAFNKAAAEELQERVRARLAVVGLSSVGLKASTFHSFGLGMIGEATGSKPRLAPWLDGGQDVGMVMRIVDELRDGSSDFRFKWDVFRLLYARLTDDLEEEVEPDGYDKATKRTGLNTFQGEVVKSQGERMIADWLFLNGVTYKYEQPYSSNVATATHSQYRPDFYYPEVDAWHEHWAIGYDGRPPASFVGYAEGMRWKRDLHAQAGTTLVETEWASINDSTGFVDLAADLERLGLALDWNPDRPTQGAKPVKHQDLARLIRTFMAHVKSNSLTHQKLDNRMEAAPKGSSLKSHRTRLFLDVYWQIHEAWEQRLAEDGSVDFEDMLVNAASHVEDGRARPRYELVLVDEFQDASQARARLVAALVKPRDRFLLAVGDDWQAINRFAGADISVMTDFESWFGAGHTLRLQTTFRCTQEICDVSSAFVSKNPRQLPKSVQSIHESRGAPVLLRYADSGSTVSLAIREWLDDLRAQVTRGEVVADRDELVTVDVLGRYRFDRDLVPDWRGAGIDVTFRTVHGAKGLEADYVVVPNVTRGLYGFPSQMADDPVLGLAMTEKKDFEHAEERRLFYVALTRARRQAVLIAVPGAESVFVTELIKDGLVEVDPNGHVPPLLCSECGDGVMVSRKGPYGEFLGCTNFPKCRHTEHLSSSE